MALPPRTRAVVTGAGSGLGRAFCNQLAKRGARIVAADVDLASAEETVKRLGPGVDAQAVRCDVSVASEVHSLAETAEKLFGGTDLVVNNAGVAVAGPVGDISLEDWNWIVGVNLWGVVYGCHEWTPRFRQQKSGHFINVASAAGLLCTPLMAPYNMTKAGVVALSETMHAELARDGVGVSVLCPTFFKTNVGKSARGVQMPAMSELVEKLMDRSPFTADDIARIALEAADRNTLYVVPHADGRWLWRLKRTMPGRFYDWMPRLLALQQKRMGATPR